MINDNETRKQYLQYVKDNARKIYTDHPYFNMEGLKKVIEKINIDPEMIKKLQDQSEARECTKQLFFCYNNTDGLTDTEKALKTLKNGLVYFVRYADAIYIAEAKMNDRKNDMGKKAKFRVSNVPEVSSRAELQELTKPEDLYNTIKDKIFDMIDPNTALLYNTGYYLGYAEALKTVRRVINKQYK
jgi:hypothetical protein